MTHFHRYSEHGLLPCEGLVGDQSAGFFAFCGEVGSERARIDAARRRQEEMKRRTISHAQ